MRGPQLRHLPRTNAGASFAGQHGTYYDVDAARLGEMVRRCWGSLWSAEAVVYRTSRGVPHASVAMAVVVREMVAAEVSGVAFTVEPLRPDGGEMVVEASWGMGAAVVDGRVGPDRWHLAREGLVVRRRRVADERFMVEPRPGKCGAPGDGVPGPPGPGRRADRAGR